MLRAAIALATALSALVATEPLNGQSIRDVKISNRFFNPSLGQTIGVEFSLTSAGALSALVLDRDGYAVRSLVDRKPQEAGPVVLSWDGRDSQGQVVADEAYSLKIDLETPAGRESYFPANSEPEETTAQTTFYDRQHGTIGYRLAKPSRVHLQAGSSKLDPRTQEWVGPCLKTIVNREPRAGGSVIDYWDGFDESGTIYVPDLPNFVTSLFATALPDNALITVGNRHTSFLEQAAARSGQSLMTFRAAKGEHHQGLTAFEDVSPRLRIDPIGATWSAENRIWSARGGRNLVLRVSLEGPSATAFAREPGGLMLFVDEQPLKTVAIGPAPLTVTCRLPKEIGRTHRITVNWVTEFGPVAGNSLKIRRGVRPPQATGALSEASAAAAGKSELPGGQP